MSYGGQNYGGQKGGQQQGMQQPWQNSMMGLPGDFGGGYYSMGNSRRNQFAMDNNGGMGPQSANPFSMGPQTGNPLARPGMPTSGLGNPNPLARGPNNMSGSIPGLDANVGSSSYPGSGTGYNPLQGADQSNPYGSPNGTFVPPQGFDPNSQYTSFDWNNISPATRALLGYRG